MCYINYVCASTVDHTNTEDRHYLFKQIMYLKQKYTLFQIQTIALIDLNIRLFGLFQITNLFAYNKIY